MHQVAVLAALISTRPQAYFPSLPGHMRKLQAVRHAGDLLIPAVERSSPTSKGVALAAFSVTLRVPAFHNRPVMS